MTDESAPKIDADTLELIERRLSEKIEADIRGRLFKSYLGMGAVVLAILGYVGFNITSQIKTDIESTFNNTFVSKFQDKMDAIKDKATMIVALRQSSTPRRYSFLPRRLLAGSLAGSLSLRRNDCGAFRY